MRVCVGAFVVGFVGAFRAKNSERLQVFHDTFKSYPTVPIGVNFGGWLCLEDWFHSGNGRFVSTPGANFPDGQGACLPPGLTQHDTRWQSEGRLVKQLVDKYGEAKAIEIFQQHRAHYITDADLDAVASAGIKNIRIPITWAAFPDALFDLDGVYTSFDAVHDVRVVPDPYYFDTHAMVTIPRGWLQEILRKCADRGLKVNWDIHAYPGGAAEGTFNGIWPEKPQFWKSNSRVGNTAATLRNAGVQIAAKLFEWVKNLPPKERSAVVGVSPMNEPAHLSWGEAEWGSYEDVFSWYAEVGGHFKVSGLGKDVKLYVQLINTAFPDWGVNFLNTTKDWWNGVFTEDEQKTFAVMDHHWYSAWSGVECSGRTVEGGAYMCNASNDEIKDVLASKGCMRPWAEKFHGAFPHLKAISEFSIGTFHEADKACKDKRVQDLYLDAQVRTWNEFNIEPFFWTWRMPYGPEFEPGWSLKYILGLEDDSLNEPCLKPITDRYIAPTDDSADDGTHQVE